MRQSPKVLAVCGSLRDESHTRTTLRHVLSAANDAGGETQLLDLREADLPLFDPDLDEQGDSEEIMRMTREADAVVLGSPVYHGSYSSAMKNYLDYCGFDEFEDTTVGLVAIAGGGTFGPTLEHLRAVCRGVHAWVLPHQVGVRKAYDAFEDGVAPEGQRGGDGEAVVAEFEDESLAERVETLGREVVEYADISPETIPTREEQSAYADD